MATRFQIIRTCIIEVESGQLQSFPTSLNPKLKTKNNRLKQTSIQNDLISTRRDDYTHHIATCPSPTHPIFRPSNSPALSTVVMNGKYACLFQSRFIHWFIMEHRRNYANVKYIMIRSFKLDIFYSTCLFDTKNRTILDNWIFPLHNSCHFRSCVIITHIFSIYLLRLHCD